MLVGLLLLQCVVAAFDYNSYTYHYTVEDLPGNYTLHWKTDATQIFLAITAQTLGWVGFGIGEPGSGSMPGADIVAGSVVSGTASIKDYYATDKITPFEDPGQDWVLVGGQETGGYTILEMRRLLDTKDINDRPIILTSPTFIVCAHGNDVTEQLSYHGLANRKATAVHFGTGVIADPLAALKMDPNIFTVDIRQNYNMTLQITDYVYSDKSDLGLCLNPWDLAVGAGCANYITNPGCAGTTPYGPVAFLCKKACNLCTVSQTNQGPIYVVAMEVLTNNVTASHVHHVVVKTTDTSAGVVGGVEFDIWASAHGSAPFLIPQACSYKFGPGGLIAPYLQTHYDNAAQKNNGVNDQSGVRLYYSRTARGVECGMISLGDPDVRLSGIQISGLTNTTFICNSSCTTSIPTLHVFGSLLHMHGTGRRIYTELWRNGARVTTTNAIDFYDSGFQRLTSLNFDFLAGDELRTTCIHYSNPPVIWGPGTDNEMCMEFVYYYPKLPSGTSKCGYPQPSSTPPVCGSWVPTTTLTANVITSFGTGAQPTPGNLAPTVGSPAPPSPSPKGPASSAWALKPAFIGILAVALFW